MKTLLFGVVVERHKNMQGRSSRKNVIHPEPVTDTLCLDSKDIKSPIHIPKIMHPDEKSSWIIRIGFISVIIILLIIALAVKFYIKDEGNASTQTKHSNSNNVTIVLSSYQNLDIVTEKNDATTSIPIYLNTILSKLNKLFSKLLDIKHKSISTQFKYEYQFGFNRSESLDIDCYNQTLDALTNQYRDNQIMLIDLLSPSHKQDYKQDYNNYNDQEIRQEIIGGYGGGFQVYCDGNILIDVGGGASFIDSSYPLFLDVEDLIDMNLLNTNKLSFNERGGIQIYPKNIRYIKHKYVKQGIDMISINLTLGSNGKDDEYNKYLKMILKEASICYKRNYPTNNVMNGLYLVGGGGGNAINQCNYDDILGDGFFYDYYESNW